MPHQHFNFSLKFQFKIKKFKKKKKNLYSFKDWEKKNLEQLFQFFLNFFKKQTLY